MQLFRQQAITAQSGRLHGEVFLLPRLSHGLILLFVLLWLAAVLLWLVNGSYARRETVRGWLEPVSGVARVYASSGGVVKSVLVEEGDQVVQGQPLVVLNGDRVLASGEHLEELLLAQYREQRELLTRRLAREQRDTRHRKTELRRQLSGAQRELELLDLQLHTLRQRRVLHDSKVSRFRALTGEGHVAAADLEAALQQQLALDSEHQALRRSRVNQQRRVEQLQVEQLLLPGEVADRSDGLRMQLSEIAGKVAQLHGQRSSVVTAPRAGMVRNIQVIPGQRSPAGDLPLLTIAPVSAELQVRLMLPVRAAGFVREGQALQIRYEAFPYQKFGLYRGRVTRVSHVVQLPGEMQGSPLALREPAYPVEAVLEQPWVEASGQRVSLKPGMTLEVDIQLDERSLLQWLLEPLYTLRGRV